MIVKGNPCGAVVQVLVLVPFFVGLVGAVYLSDVWGWDRLVGFLLCIALPMTVGLVGCLFVAWRTKLHSTRIWFRK